MSRIDFLISNDRHHVAMMLPIIQQMQAQHHCRLLSLCELRGIVTPEHAFPENVPVLRLAPNVVRASRTAGTSGRRQPHARLRGFLYMAAWHTAIKPRVHQAFAQIPDLVVVPNDAGYPFNYFAATLRKMSIPFVLLQEGIRFDLQAETLGGNYGKGGAAAVAAWGQTSKDYFLRQGVDNDSIVVTGNPRFDVICSRNWRIPAEELRSACRLGKRNLLFLSNPIETQAFGSKEDKEYLVRRLIAGLDPLFEDPEFHLIIKLHSRESAADFQRVVDAFPAHSRRITILESYPLYPLLALADGAIVLASTVGLEALLFDVPLGVLEIPGVGFAHDYAQQHAAMAITWAKPIASQVQHLLDAWQQHSGLAIEKYVSQSVAHLGDATTAICNLIGKFLRNE